MIVLVSLIVLLKELLVPSLFFAYCTPTSLSIQLTDFVFVHIISRL